MFIIYSLKNIIGFSTHINVPYFHLLREWLQSEFQVLHFVYADCPRNKHRKLWVGGWALWYKILKIVCINTGPEILRWQTRSNGRCSSRSSAWTVVTKVTFSRDTFEENWNLEWQWTWDVSRILRQIFTQKFVGT